VHSGSNYNCSKQFVVCCAARDKELVCGARPLFAPRENIAKKKRIMSEDEKRELCISLSRARLLIKRLSRTSALVDLKIGQSAGKVSVRSLKLSPALVQKLFPH
jgi:hypothetical protein